LVACLLTNKTGATDPDLATMATLDAAGSVAFQNVANRQTLTSVTKSTPGAQQNANDRIDWDAANLTFPAEAVTVLAMVIFDKTVNTDETTRIPIAFYDTGFGVGIDITGGLNVTITDFLRLT
jgi:hypothetical protein